MLETVNNSKSDSNIVDRAVRATKWSFAAQVASKIITPVTTLILAHILAPAAFGVVATVNMVLNLADVFSDAGFQKYLVQHNYKTQEDFNRSACVAFWTNFIFSVVLFAVISCFRDQIASFVGSEGCGDALAVASLALLLTSLTSVQTGVFQRDLCQKPIFIAKVGSAILVLLSAVPLALLGYDYWSLILSSLLGSLFSCIVLTYLSPWKPRFFYSVRLLRKMFSFSGWTLIESLLIWLSVWAGTFIVGNCLTATDLGMYKTSISLVSAATGLITGAVMPIVFSCLSRFQNEKLMFDKMFYKFQLYIAIFVVPLSFCIFVFRDSLVWILLGSQWAPGALFMGLFGFSSSIKIVFSNICSEGFRSMGKPKFSSLVQVMYLLIKIPILYFSASCGFEVFSYGGSLVELTIVPIALIFAKKELNLRFSKMLHKTSWVYLAAFGTAIISCILVTLNDNQMIQLALILVFVVVYTLILTLNKNSRDAMLDLVARFVRL